MKSLSQSVIKNIASVKNSTLCRRGILALFAIIIVASPIGCGKNKQGRFSHLGYRAGGGHYSGGHYFGSDVYIGYNNNGHEIRLEFLPLHGNYGNSYGNGYGSGYGYGQNGRNGPVDIRGEVVFSDLINPTGYYSRSGYGRGYDRGGYGHGGAYDRGGYGHGYGYGYDPCYIEPNIPYQVQSDNQFGQATLQGANFGNYELLAYGSYGEIVSISPVNPQIGASFTGGHNTPNGSLYVYMDVVVQRIDDPNAYCPQRQVTFGSSI